MAEAIGHFARKQRAVDLGAGETVGSAGGSFFCVLQRLTSLTAVDQFVLQCGPAETQRNFQKLRRQYGSFWAYVCDVRRACIAGLKSLPCVHSDPASHPPSPVLSCVVAGRWHGSEWCNWHSILRNGVWFATQRDWACAKHSVCALSSLRPPLFPLFLLWLWAGLKNMSNSKFMTTGAAYGAGSVYTRVHARAALPDAIKWTCLSCLTQRLTPLLIATAWRLCRLHEQHLPGHGPKHEPGIQWLWTVWHLEAVEALRLCPLPVRGAVRGMSACGEFTGRDSFLHSKVPTGVCVCVWSTARLWTQSKQTTLIQRR